VNITDKMLIYPREVKENEDIEYGITKSFTRSTLQLITLRSVPPQNTVLLEKPIVTQLAKKFYSVYVIRIFIPFFFI